MGEVQKFVVSSIVDIQDDLNSCKESLHLESLVIKALVEDVSTQRIAEDIGNIKGLWGDIVDDTQHVS